MDGRKWNAYFSRDVRRKIDASHFNLQKRFRPISISRMYMGGCAYITPLKSREDKNNGPASRASNIDITKTAGRRLESDVRSIYRSSKIQKKRPEMRALPLSLSRTSRRKTSTTSSGRSEPSRAAANSQGTASDVNR